MKCETCGHGGLFRPVQSTIVGHVDGQPVRRNLCAKCTQDAKRHLARCARAKQAQQEADIAKFREEWSNG